MVSRVELFALIRRDVRVEGLSVRALADRHGVHRRTVRQALGSAVPPPRKAPARPSPVTGPLRGAMDEMLRADLDAPPKQRHTAHRIWERLVDEHGATIAYRTVSKYVAARRPEILLEARNRAGVMDGFVPQTHLPGQDAEVDFAEVWVNVGGVDTKCFLFTLRMSFSGKAIDRVYSSQGQEAFFAGHVAAFTELGGVPAGDIRYDNLSSAVRRVCFGRSRVETDRWVLFKSAYGVTSFYCMPGKEGAHEKGGVEGEGGRFRRRWFVPVPKIADISELAGINDKLAAADQAEDARHIDQRVTTIGQDFAFEAPLLAALPVDEFDIALTTTPRVDRYARITVRQALYSVPARLIGQTVRAKLGAEELLVLHGSSEVARHPRLTTKGGQHLVLDHYLEVLAGKPGALRGATALVHARKKGWFTTTHDAFWAAARAKHGDQAGTRLLIEVLLLHRRMSHAHVIAGLRVTLAAGSVSPDVVAIEARKHAAAAGDTTVEASPPQRSRSKVVSLPERRRSAELPPDCRPAPPSVEAYDQLLRTTPRKGNAS
jgi:transposase